MADNTILNNESNVKELLEAVKASGGNLKFGLNNINVLKFGTNSVQKIMYGSTEVWNTTIESYSITYNLTKCYIEGRPESISTTDRLNFYVIADKRYRITESCITITGCSYSVDTTDGCRLSLYNPNSNVVVTIIPEPFAVYTITYNLTNCYGDGVLPTTIKVGSGATINLLTNDGYIITDDCIQITGDDYWWTPVGDNSYRIYLTDSPTNNVIVTVTAITE